MSPEIRFEHPHAEGHSFRRMAVVETGGKYRFQDTSDFVFIYNFNLFPDHREISFRDEQGREWMRMTQRTKIVRHGYAWNGNSGFKRGFRIFGRDFWTGTPDKHPGTLEASNSHDPDFQFHGCEHWPKALTLERVNYHYYLLAKANRYGLANAFHGALKDFSRAAWEAASKNPVHSVLL